MLAVCLENSFRHLHLCKSVHLLYLLQNGQMEACVLVNRETLIGNHNDMGMSKTRNGIRKRKRKRNMETEYGNGFTSAPQRTCSLPSLCIACFLSWLFPKLAPVNVARLYTDFTGVVE